IEKDEIRKMKQEGKPKADIQQKVLDYYENLTGDAKEEASEKLRGGCRELLKQIVGDEKMAELKQMKDSGVGLEELRAKVDDMLGHVTDEAKKKKIHEYGPTCRKIFETPLMRNRRHQISDSLKYHDDTNFQWFTDEEKNVILEIIGGKKSKIDMLKAIFFYYQNLREEEKERAAESLRLVCEDVFRGLVDENRLLELQALEDDGSSISELMKMLSAATDKSKFIQIRTYQTACHRIFDSGQFRKTIREYNDQALDNYFQNNLKWLSVEQKEELRKMKENGKSKADMVAKVFRYYDELFGEAKQRVTELLFDGCRQILKDVFGGDRYNELARMKDSGANVNDLKAIADSMFSEIVDKEKEEKIKTYGSLCRKIFARVNRERSLEEHFKTDLKWLTEKQKDKVLKIKEENNSKTDIQRKILHFYEDLNEEAKEIAEFINGACHDMIVKIFGDENAAELQKVIESVGITDEIRRKMDGMINEIQDEDKRAKAREYGPICQKIFDYQHKHHEHSPADFFHIHLKWLSEMQKDEIKKMKTDGKSREEIQSKIFEFFENASSETKKYATNSLLESCHELLKMIDGEEKVHELQSELPAKKIEKKITSIIDFVTSQSEKAHDAKAFVTSCMNLYNIRMNRQKQGSEKLFHAYLT
ncbi:unnamed protein product, partial [Cercopithifilaria johnstoni]